MGSKSRVEWGLSANAHWGLGRIMYTGSRVLGGGGGGQGVNLPPSPLKVALPP